MEHEFLLASTYVVIENGKVVQTITAFGAKDAFSKKTEKGKLFLEVGGQEDGDVA